MTSIEVTLLTIAAVVALLVAAYFGYRHFYGCPLGMPHRYGNPKDGYFCCATPPSSKNGCDTEPCCETPGTSGKCQGKTPCEIL